MSKTKDKVRSAIKSAVHSPSTKEKVRKAARKVAQAYDDRVEARAKQGAAGRFARSQTKTGRFINATDWIWRTFGKDAVDKILASNHPEWYANGADGLSANTIQTLGMNFSLNKASEIPGFRINMGDNQITRSVAMAQVCDVFLSTYASGDEMSLYPVAIQNIWRDLSSRSGRTPNYDENTVHRYLYGWRNILAALTQFLRAYEAANTFSNQDTGMPNVYGTALGYDMQDIQANSADIRTYLSISMKRLFSRYAVPNLTVFDRTAWMFNCAFADSDTPKATLMFYKMPIARLITEQNDLISFNVATSVPAQINSETDPNVAGLPMTTWTAWKTRFNNLIGTFNEEFSNSDIMADMLRVYGDNTNGAMYKTLYDRITSDNPALKIVEDEYQKTQWQNTMPLCSFTIDSSRSGDPEPDWALGASAYQTSTNSITPTDPDDLYPYAFRISVTDRIFTGNRFPNEGLSNPTYALERSLAPDRIYINTYDPTLDQLKQVSITRLALGTVAVDDPIPYRQVDACGTEVPMWMANFVLIRERKEGYNIRILPHGTIIYMRPETVTMASAVAENMIALSGIASNIDFCPALNIGICYGRENETLIDVDEMDTIFDWSTWAQLTIDQLQTYHAVATWGLFAAQGVAKTAFTDSFAAKNR